MNLTKRRCAGCGQFLTSKEWERAKQEETQHVARCDKCENIFWEERGGGKEK